MTTVTSFPKLRLSPTVTRVRETLKSSSNSAMLSDRTLMDEHICAPSPEPGAKVRVVESELKSPSLTVAMCTYVCKKMNL